MATYLVTGCAGFIASKVTEFLLAGGHEVVGIDNLNDAYDEKLKHWRLARLKEISGFESWQLDMTNRQALERAWQDRGESGFDAVINLGARAGVRQSVENPWVYFETNVTGTLNLLELCRSYEVKKFVLASSSSLYGENSTRPFKEDANTNQPLSPYAASKKAAEELCYTYHHLYQIDVTIFRYFTVYGPGGRPDMSPFRFVQWISEGRPVTIFGDGTQERDFTYIDDIARGTIAGLKPVGYEIVNLGSDQPVVLNQFIRLVEEVIGKEANRVYKPSHPTDVKATWANIDKAKELLNWSPQYSFQDGVVQLITWYQDNREWLKEIKTT